jgi:L-aminopeptidase/D-esterase-like protein
LGPILVGALAVVNAAGDVRDGEGRIIAGARDEQGGFLDAAQSLAGGAIPARWRASALQHTTLAFIATNVTLTRVELRQLARAASAALFRRITPAGTSVDGDIVFAAGPHESPGARVPPLVLEPLSVRALEMAIERAVRLARGRDGVPGLADGG